MTHMKQA